MYHKIRNIAGIRRVFCKDCVGGISFNEAPIIPP